jgi:hypothetical protein
MQDSNCRFMRESEHAAPSTVRRRLAALSSLFKHLVRHGEAARNPVAEIERPAINRDEGTKEALILPSGLLCRRNTPGVFLGICSFFWGFVQCSMGSAMNPRIFSCLQPVLDVLKCWRVWVCPSLALFF